MKKIGIVVNPERDPGYEYTAKTVAYLQKNGFDVFLQQNVPSVSGVMIPDEETFFSSVEAVVTLGGDGTVLRIAQKASMYQTPVLGINLGHLGYLTQLEKDDLEQLADILNTCTGVEQRFMLRARIVDGAGQEQAFYALNEVVLGRQIVNNMLHASLYSNGEFIYKFSCDCLIFATPTGSTAYSMSSGGPIADCRLQDIVIFTPVCEHSFFSKSMIFSASDTLACEVERHAESTFLIIDGKTVCSMDQVQRVIIDRSPYALPLFQTDGDRFYKVLNKKFSAGGNI